MGKKRKKVIVGMSALNHAAQLQGKEGLKSRKNKLRIVVGMSGGVDSTVTVALLKKEGYDVEGVFLEFWKDKKSKEGFRSAKKMAEVLGIKISKVNAEKDFKKKVVDKFIGEYKCGRTPNPCIVCNPEMKFEVLLREANKRNARLATGHYVRLRRKISNFKFQISNKIQNPKSKNVDENEYRCLYKAKDRTKDQSYFLYGLKPEQLEKAIFPLGNYLKSEVREIAQEMGLAVADRDESQDVCFVSQDNFDDFLMEYIKNKPGKIQNDSGEVLGEHKGLHFYTIGQRKGINLGGDGPYYVVRKDIENNVLIVSNNEKNKNFLRDSFKVGNVNWISKNIEFPLKAGVKVRYNSEEVYGIITKARNRKRKTENDEENVYDVELNEGQKAITPGQSAVFYDGEEVLGGGIIM